MLAFFASFERLEMLVQQREKEIKFHGEIIDLITMHITNTQQDTSPTSESQAKRLPAVLVGIGLSSTKPDADQILQ